MFVLIYSTEALGTTWTKYYAQYQKENRILTMIPYNQVAGKGVSYIQFKRKRLSPSQQLLLHNAIVHLPMLAWWLKELFLPQSHCEMHPLVLWGSFVVVQSSANYSLSTFMLVDKRVMCNCFSYIRIANILFISQDCIYSSPTWACPVYEMESEHASYVYCVLCIPSLK